MKDQLELRKEAIDTYVERYFSSLEIAQFPGIQKLKESMGYSLLKGGKRFRPLLCLLIAESFGIAPSRILPWATAVEMIHAYSLIHDDLPCMDNDDLRRGEPTNHKVFGETTALLAGDALLTEAFRSISDSFEQEPAVGLRLVRMLGEAAGLLGMVGGQAMDLEAQKGKVALQELKLMHALKTGSLIRVCAEGTAVLCGLNSEKIQTCRDFGAELGLAFQLKDDLLDSSEGRVEQGSFPGVLGVRETSDYLQDITDRAFAALNKLEISQGLLRDLVIYNQNRQI